MSEYLQSELPAIELFKRLGYEYFDSKCEMYEVVLEDRLTSSLGRINPCLNENNLQKVIRKILATTNKKLEVLRAKKEKYETLKKGLLQKLLSGEVRV